MKVVSIVGARPQFIKAAVVSRALADTGEFDEIMVHTGQHFDESMSDVFFRELNIPTPKYNLSIHGGSHGSMTGKMLAAVEQVLQDEKPGLVIVYGDTNSTLAGALAAAKLNIDVAHVEAGLRSFNRKMPEEVNRVLTDHISRWLFCPTSDAVSHLEKEGLINGVYHVGDVMYDAALIAAERAKQLSTIIDSLGLREQKYYLATIHRAENTNDKENLSAIAEFLSECAARQVVVLPLHPRTRAALKAHRVEFSGVMQIEPVGYLDMTQLILGCTEVLTDSGGLQKEAYFHRKRCVTLRDETEWEETITHGWNRLWKDADYKQQKEITDYGTGSAGQTIVARLKNSCES